MARIRFLQRAALLLLVPVLAACQSQPIGNDGGRIDPYATTEAERSSGKILPATLLEFSDDVAQKLARELSDRKEVRDAGEPVIIIMGDINNLTENVSSTEFEMVRSRIRHQLLQSDHVRKLARFVENRSRLARLAERERVASDGFFADAGDHDTSRTFVLNGDFYRIRRGEVNLYSMEFNLAYFDTGAIVSSHSITQKQIR